MKDQVHKLLEQTGTEIELYRVEKEYIKNKELVTEEQLLQIEKNSTSRFLEVYIERSNKETDELIATESSQFLEKSITYLKEHLAEFLYIESKWFDIIGVDAISLEVDDVFGTYEAMLGLKEKKNQEQTIKLFLNNELQGEEKRYNLMFNQQDGMWDLNVTLNVIQGFNEEMSIKASLDLIYQLLFQLHVELEK